jgi:hypothetical protein
MYGFAANLNNKMITKFPICFYLILLDSQYTLVIFCLIILELFAITTFDFFITALATADMTTYEKSMRAVLGELLIAAWASLKVSGVLQ